MLIQIDRSAGIPLYIQLRDEIVRAIQQGELRVGVRIPTERELANDLGVSRKTVSHAYNILEQEGVLISHQGKGTFVSETAHLEYAQLPPEAVLEHIDMAIASAYEYKMSAIDFIDLVRSRTWEKESERSNEQAVFVECNIEQARAFAEQLTERTHFKLLPLTLTELERMSDNTRLIVDNANVIIPTFNHVDEVKVMLEKHGFDKKVMGVALTPDLETVVKIAKYPDGTRFGVICISEEFFFKVDVALKSAGLKNLSIKSTTSYQYKDLKLFLENIDVVIVSPGRLKEIQGIVEANQDVIRFDYSLDDSTVKLILSKLISKKKL